MTTTLEQRWPLLERSIETERLILLALVLSGWALATIGRDLILPLLRLALRWREEPPAPAPMITSQSEGDFPTEPGILQAADTMDRDRLIGALSSNDYSREVPTAAQRNRARGFL